MSGRPAGFWHRYAAWTLDAALLALPALLLSWPTISVAAGDASTRFSLLMSTLSGLLLEAVQSAQPPMLLARQWLASPLLRAPLESLSAALTTLLLTPLFAFIAMSLVYHVAFERSRWQATPGQRALGLWVVDTAGGRLPAGHALLRFLSGTLSWLTLNVGHLMAAMPPRHLALHDRVSATRVLRRGADARMPPWARGWIALQVLAVLAANAWLLHAAMQAMQRGFERMS